MISEENVNMVFEDLIEAFRALGKLEDARIEIAASLSEYKDGSEKANEAQKKLAALQPALNTAVRTYREAGMVVDWLRMLVDVQKLAGGY